MTNDDATLLSFTLGPGPHAQAAAVAASRAVPLATYILGAIRAAAWVARPPTSATISGLVVARITSDHDRLGRAGSPEPPDIDESCLVVSGASLAVKTRAIAVHRGQHVREYLDDLLGRAAPLDGPSIPTPQLASRLAELIEADFAALPDDRRRIGGPR